MKIKKYTGPNEKEVMTKVKDELGVEALIVNVKRIKPKGLYKLFKKPYVEVTAAIDDRSVVDTLQSKEGAFMGDYGAQKPKEDTKDQEVLDEASFIQLLKDLAHKDLARKAGISEERMPTYEKAKSVEDMIEPDVKKETQTYLSVIYEQLLDNEVDEKVINELMMGLDAFDSSSQEAMDQIISTLYNRIVKKISDVDTISLKEGVKNVAVFVGPTGVGKTTTIAKIASYFTLNLGKKVGLITSDTYRIAAVEQLRTYSNILNIPIKVVYNHHEMAQAVEQYKDVDLILVDTAGRSHKNKEQQKELMELLDSIAQKEVFLVVSLATKYNDLKKICDAYKDVNDYKLIFTKLDETSSYGNIINIREKTGAKLSYVTFGQNVPNDISEFDIHDIAKKTLGGCDI